MTHLLYQIHCTLFFFTSLRPSSTRFFFSFFNLMQKFTHDEAVNDCDVISVNCNFIREKPRFVEISLFFHDRTARYIASFSYATTAKEKHAQRDRIISKNKVIYSAREIIPFRRSSSCNSSGEDPTSREREEEEVLCRVCIVK